MPKCEHSCPNVTIRKQNAALYCALVAFASLFASLARARLEAKWVGEDARSMFRVIWGFDFMVELFAPTSTVCACYM